MHLTPTEEDRLRIFSAAELARRTLARGLGLNAPEATALICDEMHAGGGGGPPPGPPPRPPRDALHADQLLPGVADLLEEIRLEVLLEEGTRLVVVRRPWG